MLAFYRMWLFRKARDFLFSRQVDILSAAVVLSGSILVSRVLGLVRDRALAHYFFGNDISIYFAAFRLPDTLFDVLIMGALSSAFIPTFISYISRRKEAEGWRVAGIAVNLALLLFLGLAVLVFVFARPFSAVVAPGFNPAEITQMAQLTRVLLLTQGLFVISSFLTGILKSYQRFLVPALAPVFYNLSIILGIVFLSKTLGIYAPAWGAVIGALLHLVIQLPLAVKLGFRPVGSLDFRHPGVRRIIKLAAPRVLDLLSNQLLKASDLFLASLITTPSYGYLTFAFHLGMLPVSLFGFALADATLPALSHRAGKREEFRETFFTTFRQIIFLILPAAAALAVLRIPLVRLAFGAARSTWDSTVLTGYALSLFAIGILGQALTTYFVRAFYALSDTLTPMKVEMTNVVLNISLSAYAILVLGLPVWGLAASFAFSALIQAAVLGVILARRNGFSLRDFILPGLRVGAAALVSGLVMYVVLKVFDRSAWDRGLSFLGSFALPDEWSAFVLDTRYTKNLIMLTGFVGAVGVGVYLLVCRLLGVRELSIFSQIGRRITRFRKPIVPAAAEEHEHVHS
ncbi:MAG: integral membrane protein MviN, virulence factor [candidate division WWE3 bacterium CSP1-7]|uniref:Probable lipid II flippase MurJ n=1 Tax=candidate division WWE3 bacterium CSP1-7 TaxID=1576480 RepID=A0A0T5ZYC7_UNCKA|nr:MAG: integral membrane protein MviN, virulence factor [candidate division WWE3 bacterium CSP1-7]